MTNSIKPEEKAARIKLFEEACKNGSYDKWIAKAKRTIKGYYWTIDTVLIFNCSYCSTSSCSYCTYGSPCSYCAFES